ncbi:MAG: D-isomer specific 2-hydroxyacid dehydrogenase NAD-binding protein [Fibrobacteres bacterium]|nr:D-isomer specific 2-hydroxyacid dehydrogenase NAD-binding protein [Fibrobacterota bacterium]
MPFKIKTLNNISQQGLKLFGDNYAVSGDASSPDAVLVRSAIVDTDEIPSMLAIARAGAGVNNISIDKATEKGVCVFNTPGANANAVAELVFIMLGIAARKIHKSLEFSQALAGEADDKAISEKVEKGKANFSGFELQGKTLAVIGLGKIGVLVSNAGLQHGMNVIGYDPFPTVANVHLLNPRVEIAHKLDDVIAQADVISVHVPLSDKTRNLIGEAQLKKAKNGVILMNYARKGIYDDAAVVAGLESGKVSHYINDFPSKALLGRPNVICTPHLGASTAESEENCAVMAVKQLRNYLEYGIVANSVNFPIIEVYPEESTRTRVVVINKDVPNMIAQITQVIGKAGLNIVSFTNASNGKVGYNIIDLDKDLSEALVETIKAIGNVVKVRVLRFPQK